MNQSIAVSLHVTEQAKMSKLPRLAYRRLRGYPLEIYKVLNGQCDEDTVQFCLLWKDEAVGTGREGNMENYIRNNPT